MCGVAGIFGSEANIKKKTNKMLRIIKHRGPDQTCQISYKNFCGGTVRLSIEAIKNGSQPIENKNSIIGFNGEIFNYKEIIKKFKFFHLKSEISVIQKLYEILGVNFIHEIKGQFGIFIFDKIKSEVFLFRDPYGIRPLFYHLNKNIFFFSSEIKSIVTASNKNFKINTNSIGSTALFWTNIGDMSSVENILQVEPGYFIKFNGKKITKFKYYNDPLLDKKIIKKKKKSVYEIIKKSVKNQLQSEVGYACTLSGGIDSAGIAYILSKMSKKPIDTFSVCFEDHSYDESKFQNKIVKLINSSHKFIKIRKKDISENFEKTIYHSESILFRTAPVPMYLLYKLISKNNHKVIFSGEGSDEITLGYDIFFENRLRRKWKPKYNSEEIAKEFGKLYNYLPQFKNKRYLKLSLEFFKKFKLTKQNDIYFSHLSRWSQYDQISKYFKLDKKLKSYLILKLNKILDKKKLKEVDSDKKCQLIEISTLLSNYLLSSQGDRMSMANSVEGRYPYLDHDFINFFSKINSSTKAPKNKSKKLFRDAFKGKIPQEIRERPKTAYQAPEAKAFLDHNYLSATAKEFIKNYKKLNYFNNKNIEDLIKKIRHPYSSERLGFRENMGFIMCLSVYFLDKSIKKWKKFK